MKEEAEEDAAEEGDEEEEEEAKEEDKHEDEDKDEDSTHVIFIADLHETKKNKGEQELEGEREAPPK